MKKIWMVLYAVLILSFNMIQHKILNSTSKELVDQLDLANMVRTFYFFFQTKEEWSWKLLELVVSRCAIYQLIPLELEKNGLNFKPKYNKLLKKP